MGAKRKKKVSPAVHKRVRERSLEFGWDPKFIERLISGQEGEPRSTSRRPPRS